MAYDESGVWEAFSRVERPARSDGGYDFSEQDILKMVAGDQRSLDERMVGYYLSGVLLTHGTEADLRFLLPGILHSWNQRRSQNSYFNERLAAALGRGDFLNRCLESRQRTAVVQFVASVILRALADIEPGGRTSPNAGT